MTRETRIRDYRSGLNFLQHRFVEEYCVDYDRKRAVEAAGYNVKRPSIHAHTLLQMPKIRAAIEERRKEESERSRHRERRLVAELEAVAFSNLLDYVIIDEATGLPRTDFKRLTRSKAAAIAEVTIEEFTMMEGEEARPARRVKFKLNGAKVEAIMNLGRYHHGWKDGVTKTVEGDVVDEAAPAPTDPVEASRAYRKLVDGG